MLFPETHTVYRQTAQSSHYNAVSLLVSCLQQNITIFMCYIFLLEAIIFENCVWLASDSVVTTMVTSHFLLN